MLFNSTQSVGCLNVFYFYTFGLAMVKKVFIKKLGAVTFLMVLLCSVLFSFPNTSITNIEKAQLTSKQMLSQSYINAAELCEETEVKDVIESLQQISTIQLYHSYIGKLLSSNLFLTLPHKKIVVFAGTTNFPIYIAKRSYLL